MTVWRAFVTRMAREEAPTTLALFRVAVGLVLASDLLNLLLSGAMPAMWYPRAEGGLRPPGHDHWLWTSLGAVTGFEVNVVLAVTLAACLALVLGVGARFAAVAALVGAQALFVLSPGSGGGHDRLLTNALFLLALSGAGSSFSLVTRVRTGRWTSDVPIPAWPRYILIHQLVIMYVSTGLSKVGVEWWPMGSYDAVYRALLMPAWARADWWPVAYVYPLTQLGTAITPLWEGTWWVVLLWLVARDTRDRGGRWRRWLLRFDLRLPYVVIGLVVHGLLWLMLDLGPFSAITLSWYVCLFHPDELAAAWARLVGPRPPSRGGGYSW